MSTLVEMAARYGAECDAFVGMSMTQETADLAREVALRYCAEVKLRWGIELSPTITMSEAYKSISFYVLPEAGSYDEAMWTALQRREGLLPAEEPKKTRKRAA